MIFPVHSQGRRKGPRSFAFGDWFSCLNRAPSILRERIIIRLCAECVSPENDRSCFPGMGIKYIFTYTLLEKLGLPTGQFCRRQANIWAFCQRNKMRHWYAKKLLTESVLLLASSDVTFVLTLLLRHQACTMPTPLTATLPPECGPPWHIGRLSSEFSVSFATDTEECCYFPL